MAMTRGSDPALDVLPVDAFIEESRSRHVRPVLQHTFGDIGRGDHGGRAETNERALEGDS